MQRWWRRHVPGIDLGFRLWLTTWPAWSWSCNRDLPTLLLTVEAGPLGLTLICRYCPRQGDEEHEQEI